MKIVLIGPIFPYRGGIAHFNDCIVRELKLQNIELSVISWRRRYPSFLYPGKSQFDKDKINILKSQPNVFILDIYNPFSWIKTAFNIRKFKPDLLILNWVTPYLAPVLLTLIKIGRFKIGIKIVLICHNVKPHENRIFDKYLSTIIFKNIDLAVVHASTEENILINEFNFSKKNVLKLFHPEYDFFRSKQIKRELRDKLKIPNDTFTLLFFGYVRHYKGLDILFNALKYLYSKLKNFHLVVAGEFWEDLETYTKILSQDNMSDRVTIIDEYIDDCEVGNYFDIADLTVLPYRSATQSGIINIATDFNKPCLISKAGGLIDLDVDDSLISLYHPNTATVLAESIYEIYKKHKGYNSNLSYRISHEQTWENYSKSILTNFMH